MRYRHTFRKVNKRSKWKPFVLTFFIIVIIFISYYYTQVRIVSVKSSKSEQKDLVNMFANDLSKELVGSNILFFDNHSLTIEKDGVPITFSIDHVEKIYPNKLKVYVSMDSETLKIRKGQDIFYISEDGLVVSESNSSDDTTMIPEVDFNVEVGSIINKSVFKVIKVLIPSLDSEAIRSIVVKNNVVQIMYVDGYTVYFPILCDEDMLSEKLMLLKKILQQYTIDSRGIDTIDLRYSKPIIRFK